MAALAPSSPRPRLGAFGRPGPAGRRPGPAAGPLRRHRAHQHRGLLRALLAPARPDLGSARQPGRAGGHRPGQHRRQPAAHLRSPRAPDAGPRPHRWAGGHGGGPGHHHRRPGRPARRLARRRPAGRAGGAGRQQPRRHRGAVPAPPGLDRPSTPAGPAPTSPPHGGGLAMRRSILAAVVLSVLVALAGGAYLYFFSGLRTTPKPLSMATPTPASSGSANATVVGDTSLMGRWKVGTGSQVGYRVREQFVGQTSPHEAVARTSSVSGGLTVQPGADGLEATGIALTADLTGLHSVDQVAGFNVSQRDFVVSRTLSVSQYPTATFRADQIPLPSNLAGGSTVTLTIPGELTIHGVARNITVTSQVRVNGDRAEATGSATIDMRDFGISPPQVPITTVQPQVTVEFQLELVRS